MPAVPRVFIYGSCVARDSVAAMPKGAVKVVSYVARSSLISAMGGRAVDPVVEWDGLSPFQRRQVEGDISAKLGDELARRRAEVDILLWDLCDERLGVFDDLQGGYLTRSIDLMQSVNRTGETGLFRHIPFSSTEHLDLFLKAAVRWRDLLISLDLLDRTFLLAPAWATRTEQGQSTPSSFGVSASRANPAFATYIRELEPVVSVPVIRPDGEPFADSAHRWGFAPFHYANDVYLSLMRQIRGLGDLA